MASPRRLNVAISGAGIGGITAALALRRAGHQVTVYERSSLSHEVGQGIILLANGGRVLKRLGLTSKDARLADYLGRKVIDATTLETIGGANSKPKGPAKDGKTEDVGMKAAYRISLHAALVRLAMGNEGEGTPVKIVTRAGVQSYDGDNARMTLESGEVVQADLIVAADGVKSTASAHIYESLPDEKCPQLDSAGMLVYRFTLPSENLLADPETKRVLDAGPGYSGFYVGPGGHAFLMRYWCRDDGLQNVSLYVHREWQVEEEGANGSACESGVQGGGLRFQTTQEQVLREMEGFHPALQKVVMKSTDVLPLWKCTTREPLKRVHRGRMAVIGDAAHVVKPHLGLGAVSAMEDAGMLGVLLSHLPEGEDTKTLISQRLQLFSDLRVGRLATYKYYSDIPIFDPSVEMQRSKCAEWMNPEDLPQTQADLIPWLIQYDAMQVATKALERLPQSNGAS